MGLAAPRPRIPTVRLGEPVEIVVEGIHKIEAVGVGGEMLAIVGSSGEVGENNESLPAGVLVDLKTKAITPFTNGHTAEIEYVVVSPDGAVVVTSTKGEDGCRIHVTDVKAGKPRPQTVLTVPDYSPAPRLAFLPPDGRIVAAFGERIGLLDPSQKTPNTFLTADALAGLAAGGPVAARDGKSLACFTVNGDIVTWNLTTGTAWTNNLLPEMRPLPRDRDDPEDNFLWRIRPQAFTRGGRLLVVRRCLYERGLESAGWPDYRETPEADVPPARRAILELDPRAKTATPIGIGHPWHVGPTALYPSDEWLAVFGVEPPDRPMPDKPDKWVTELRVYHYPTRKLAGRIQFPFDGFSPFWVGFTPDGKKLVAVAEDGKVRAWDFAPVAP